VKLLLRLRQLRDAPRTLFGFPALAWSTHEDDGSGTIHVVRGFHLVFFSEGRKVHEAEHLLTGIGNEMHAGHTWHLCARAWHALRYLYPLHASRGALCAAHLLNRDGDTCEVTLDG